jgi:transcriptional regulator with XRE-family HTH domain
MSLISTRQIKAARAFIGWSRKDFADATGLSIATVRKLENLKTGCVSAHSSAAIRLAVEAEGWEFTDNEGIRRKVDGFRVYEGVDSVDAFFEDIMETVKQTGSDIYAYMKSQDTLAETLGIAKNCKPERVDRLDKTTNIKCLLFEEALFAIPMSKFQFRMAAKHSAAPVSYYVYGRKYALVMPEGMGRYKFFVFNWLDLALSQQRHFDYLWDISTPFVTQQDETYNNKPHLVAQS